MVLHTWSLTLIIYVERYVWAWYCAYSYWNICWLLSSGRGVIISHSVIIFHNLLVVYTTVFVWHLIMASPWWLLTTYKGNFCFFLLIKTGGTRRILSVISFTEYGKLVYCLLYISRVSCPVLLYMNRMD